MILITVVSGLLMTCTPYVVLRGLFAALQIYMGVWAWREGEEHPRNQELARLLAWVLGIISLPIVRGNFLPDDAILAAAAVLSSYVGTGLFGLLTTVRHTHVSPAQTAGDPLANKKMGDKVLLLRPDVAFYEVVEKGFSDGTAWIRGTPWVWWNTLYSRIALCGAIAFIANVAAWAAMTQ